MSGQYRGKYEYPLTPGAEGAGTVIESGGGFLAWTLVGKRVAFIREVERGGLYTKGGAYAEYCVTNAWQCVTLDDDTSFETGACQIANPLSAIGLLDRCVKNKARAVIQTGAAS